MDSLYFTAATVRRTWIVFFILWILYGLSAFLRYALGTSAKAKSDEAGTAGATAESTEKGITGVVGNDRLHRAHLVLRDLVLTLLSAILINGFGRVTTIAVEALSWCFLGLSLIWAIVELVTESRPARAVLAFLTYGIALALFILAFASGWHL
ncbi:uncharacterized protein VTP21DRAFT_11126 [Calcarisporiella thermophila]|uniref:uncharacterized protein n=1 Tax=Calcarisporiella thermophila TaxID=911321 RepID=UPI003742C95A